MPQVISDAAIRQTAEEITQENTVFREAFRDIDIPDRTGDTYSIPVPDDVLGEPTELAPGSEFDYGREEYTEATLERTYYGSGSRIPEQELDDNVFELLADHVDRHAQKMAEALDLAAFEVLSTAAPTANEVSANSNGEVEFEDVLAGLEALESREGGYSGDQLYVGTGAKRDILNDLADRGTDLGDEATTQGEVAQYAGVSILFSNTGALEADEAILVDSDFFGYEGTWTPVSTDQEADFDTRSQKLQIFTEKGWLATQPQAAVRVVG